MLMACLFSDVDVLLDAFPRYNRIIIVLYHPVFSKASQRYYEMIGPSAPLLSASLP